MLTNTKLKNLCMNHLLKRDTTSILVLEELYLDFFNDYLTPAYAAENMGVQEDLLGYAMDLGKQFNHKTRG